MFLLGFGKETKTGALKTQRLHTDIHFYALVDVVAIAHSPAQSAGLPTSSFPKAKYWNKSGLIMSRGPVLFLFTE